MENAPHKIVVVDDNADYLFSMETFLSRNGFDVKTALNGEKGMELIGEFRPDLIILDVMMETLYSGFEVCRQIRNNPDLKEIPIIGITGMEDELDITFDKYADEEYFSPNAFFEKPVDRDALMLKIKELIK